MDPALSAWRIVHGADAGTSHISATDYDTNGNVTGTTDADGNLTESIYDVDNRLIGTEDAANLGTSHISEIDYDAAGNITGTTDALGNLTKNWYDIDDRLTGTQDPMNLGTSNISKTEYDTNSNITGTTDATGDLTENWYDIDNRLTGTRDAVDTSLATISNTLIAQTDYDTNGNVTGTTDADGNLSENWYDVDNRLTGVQDAADAGTSYISATDYDAAGNVTGTTDAFGNLTTNFYDVDDRLTGTIDPVDLNIVNAISDPTERATALTDLTTKTLFDAAGNVTGMQDAGTTVTQGDMTENFYDVDDRVTGTLSAVDAGTDHYSKTFYDPAGLVTGTMDLDGQLRVYSYDVDDRETGEKWYSAADVLDQTLTFTYDVDGHQLMAADNSGAYTMSYDADGRVTSVQEPFLLDPLTFGYDTNGNRTLVEDPFGGVTTSLYDQDNQLEAREFGGTDQTPLRIDLNYNGDGELDGLTRYSNLAGTTEVGATDYTINASGQIVYQEHLNGSGSSLALATYTYDAAGNVTAQTVNESTTSFTYDSDNQLTGDGGTTENYDSEGNRTNAGYSTGPGNELLSDGTWNYSYDANGNLVGKTQVSGDISWTYAYDERNQMISAKEYQNVSGTLELKTQVVYKYDAYGNRIEQDIDSSGDGDFTVQRYALDGWNPAKGQGVGNENWAVWADLDGSNNLETFYLTGDVVDQIFARESSDGTVAWLLTDRLGSVVDVTSGSGVLEDTIAYDAFGNVLSQTNASETGRYQWTGREFDATTGLQYNRARYYDPATGRWTSQDPMGFDAGDSNLYRYANNTPTTVVDPSGYLSFTFYDVDKKYAYVQMNITVFFRYDKIVGKPAWTQTMKDEFSRMYLERVPAVWNNNGGHWGHNIYIVSSNDTYYTPGTPSRYHARFGRIGGSDPTTTERRWIPWVKITETLNQKEADAVIVGDTDNDNPVSQTSVPDNGMPNKLGPETQPYCFIHQSDVWWNARRAAHELGHAIGVGHPLGELPLEEQKKFTGKYREYAPDPDSLMGNKGTKLRSYYFKRWVEALDERSPKAGPYKAVAWWY